MALNARKAPSSGTRKAVEAMEAGSYPTRLVQVLDLGLQPQQAWQGEEKPPAYEMMLTYEFVDEFLKDDDGNDMEDKPRWLSERMPLRSLDSDLAKSTKRYYAMDPEEKKEGDFEALVSSPCLTTITAKPSKKDGVVRNYVADVTAMRPRDASKCPELVNPPKVFNLDNPDMEVFKSLPEWVQNVIKENLNFGGSPLEAALGGESKKAKEEPQVDDTEEEEDW